LYSSAAGAAAAAHCSFAGRAYGTTQGGKTAIGNAAFAKLLLTILLCLFVHDLA